MRTFIFVLLFVPSLAIADPWSSRDKALEGVFIAVTAIDWLQTRDIARNPDRWTEENSILGQHPSIAEVNTYFAILTISHIALVDIIPSEYRAPFQITTIFIEYHYISSNFSLGISAEF